jgi:hypothetical protein
MESFGMSSPGTFGSIGALLDSPMAGGGGGSFSRGGPYVAAPPGHTSSSQFTIIRPIGPMLGKTVMLRGVFVPMMPDLVTVLAAVQKLTSLSAAGHSLAKHSARPGSAFEGQAVGTPEEINATADGAVRAIVSNPAAEWTIRDTGRFGVTWEVRTPDGPGVRLSGPPGEFPTEFIGFLEAGGIPLIFPP